jgi:hypothetical protein
MALQLFIKLQTPTIELPVRAKDAAGTKDSMLVGFKRYELTQSQEKLNTLQELLKEAESANSLNSTLLDSFIKDEIVYIKQAKLDLADNGVSKELIVSDTRTVKPIADLWGTGEECLSVLLEMYLSSAPYRLALILATQKALLNNDYSEAEVKN